MNTEIVIVNPTNPDPRTIARAAEVLRAGRLLAFPTETVYGLGANALDPLAARGIFWAKGRPPSNPLIVHVHDTAQVANVAAEWPATAARLAERFWPGPLTIVVPKGANVPDEVTAGGPTVAVRCPNHGVAQALLREVGFPLAAPSANRSGELSPTRAEHVVKSLGGHIDMILDGGPCPGGIESTVVDVTGPVVRVLRPGLITVPMLEEVVGKIELATAPEEIARSPGQMEKHYSPRTPVVLTHSRNETISSVREVLWSGRRVGVLLRDSPSFSEVMVIPCYRFLPDDPVGYAAWMYQALHEFDEKQLSEIVIELPPDTLEWAAIRDRLTRTAGRS